MGDMQRSLAYRLRRGVRVKGCKGASFLVLGYPLKTLKLHGAWGPLLDKMARAFVELEEIARGLGSNDRERVASFLNGLVRSGFVERKGVMGGVAPPSVTVIVPVHNRPREIEACLQSLLALDYPSRKLEIIVVDDASSDHTPDVVSRFPVRLIRLKTNRKAPFCRNLAAWEAFGEILAFIDSDCLADQAWLRELVPAFHDESVAAVGGRVGSGWERKGLDRYERVHSSLDMGGAFKRSSKDQPFFYVPSCNLLVRRKLFLRLGGFKEELWVGEDVDLCWRFQDAGYAVEYQPLGTVLHRHRNRLRTFFARRFDYGTSEPLLQKLHPGRVKQMAFPPGHTLFWASWCIAFATGVFSLLGAGASVLALQSLMRWRRVRKGGVAVPFFKTAWSVTRGSFAFLYHCSSFVSRYYLCWALPASLLFPPVAWGILGAHILTCVVQYLVRKPRLGVPAYIFYFTAEQTAYQLGVWYLCLRTARFGPVNPRLRGRTSFPAEAQTLLRQGSR